MDGEVVKPGGERSTRKNMELDRPKDMLFLIDCMEKLASGGADSRFAGRVDILVERFDIEPLRDFSAK